MRFRRPRPIFIPSFAEPGYTVCIGKGDNLTRLTLGEDRILRDCYGTEYSYADEKMMLDKSDRPGVGITADILEQLPEGWIEPLNEAAKAHDHKYSSTVYQRDHSRAEADADLDRDLKTLGASPVLRFFTSIFVSNGGGGFWDNVKNRWVKHWWPGDIKK
jgi:hypothetical protein